MKKHARTTIGILLSSREGIDQLDRMFDVKPRVVPLNEDAAQKGDRARLRQE